MTSTNKLKLVNGAYSLVLKVLGLTQDREIILPPDAPTGGKSIRTNASNPNQLEWFTPATGSGTVTSVALSAPSTVFQVNGSPVVSAGTLNLAFVNQTQGFIFAAPTGAAGAPSFRAMAATDIPSLDTGKITTGTFAYARFPVGTAANTLAAGNDSRFHTQNTDTGTTAASFQIASGSSGVRLKNVTGDTLEVRNAADSGYGNLIVNNLTVKGANATVEANTVTVGDNIFVLNADYAGSTPTEDSGMEIERGSLTSASFLWDESNDFWKAGLLGTELRILRQFEISYVSGDIVGNKLTITHGLGNLGARPYIRLTNGETLENPWKPVNQNSLEIDMEGISSAGTVIVHG